jgi:thymidine kinase
MSSTIHRGTLYVRAGPMFSGKTTWLNGELTQLADTGFKVLKIQHGDDVRECGPTHNTSFVKLSDKIDIITATELRGINVSDYNVVGIDEGQFFPDLKEIVEHWVETLGKHVRVSGLDGDSLKQRFGQMLDLVPMSDEFVKLSASCRPCLAELEKTNFHGNILAIKAPFTKRLTASTEQKEIGGADKYIPVCRYHHMT